jgi:hypothetical protein
VRASPSHRSISCSAFQQSLRTRLTWLVRMAVRRGGTSGILLIRSRPCRVHACSPRLVRAALEDDCCFWGVVMRRWRGALRGWLTKW